MVIDYLDAKNQIYIPAALIIVGCGITKPAWLPFAALLTALLVWLKLEQHSEFYIKEFCLTMKNRVRSSSLMFCKNLNSTKGLSYLLIQQCMCGGMQTDKDRYRFKLPRPNDTLGLPIGQHITICAQIDGKEISRSYTPISSEDDRGYFDLMIKVFSNSSNLIL